MFFSPTTKLVFPFDSTLVKEELNLDLIEFNIFFSFNDITLKVMLLSNANSYISSDISDEVNISCNLIFRFSLNFDSVCLLLL